MLGLGGLGTAKDRSPPLSAPKPFPHLPYFILWLPRHPRFVLRRGSVGTGRTVAMRRDRRLAGGAARGPGRQQSPVPGAPALPPSP